ncbi:MAG: carboxymuconolactone decarboxylase family protein [Planctomycetaceae bacterium]
MKLQVQSIETAPAEAQAALRAVREKYGFVPNLLGIMANAPPLLKAYLALNELFQQTTLSPVEQQVVLLTISEVNRCEYCVAAHTVAARMHKVPRGVIESVRSGQPIADDRLDALRCLTTEIVEGRGWPTQAAIDDFLSAGYSSEQVLEVILAVGMKTLSNYTNHLAHTPLDTQFSPAAWTAEAPATA